MNGCRCLEKTAWLGLIAAGVLWGPGGSWESLDKMTAASDSIVVGAIVQGTVSGTTVALSIQVERALKGKWAPGAIVAATGAVSEPHPTRAAASQRGIFFLAHAGAGPMRLVPAISGFLLDEYELFVLLPASSTPAAQPAHASPRERVLLEVMGAIGGPPPKRPGGFVDAVGAYRASPTPAVRSVFRNWLTSDSPTQVALALEALLAEGDTTALLRLATDPALRSAAVDPHAFDGLKFYFKNPDPTAVSILGRLVSNASNSLPLRIAAASALAKVHTRQTLPFLAPLLDSPDLDLRTCAVGGFSMFANHVPIGSHEPAAGDWPWRTDDTIAHSGMNAVNAPFWKNWWAAHQTTLISAQ